MKTKLKKKKVLGKKENSKQKGSELPPRLLLKYNYMLI